MRLKLTDNSGQQQKNHQPIYKLVDVGFLGVDVKIGNQGHVDGTLWTRPPESLAGRDFTSYQHVIHGDTPAAVLQRLWQLRSDDSTNNNSSSVNSRNSSTSNNDNNFRSFISANKFATIRGHVDVDFILQSYKIDNKSFDSNTDGVVSLVNIIKMLTFDPDHQVSIAELTLS